VESNEKPLRETVEDFILQIKCRWILGGAVMELG
jgi:hypothetical protein